MAIAPLRGAGEWRFMVDEGPSQSGLDTLVGRVLDNQLEIIERLGSGSKGDVYLAVQQGSEVQWAVKVLERDSLRKGSSGARFGREAQVLSRLEHPNIVAVEAFRQMEGGARYLVMEYIPGPTLQQHVTLRGPLRLLDAVGALRQLAAALAYAHDQGVVHRDLKPPNVLLRHGDPRHPKLVDFGLVKLISADPVTRITADAQILGTPLYMSPEQCRAEEVGPPADIYSLASIAYFMITGRPVFAAPSVMGLLLAQTHSVPERLGLRCPEQRIPPLLDELLQQCLDKRPVGRPDAAALCDGLDEVSTQLDTAVRARQALTETVDGTAHAESIARQIWQVHQADESPAAPADPAQFMREALSNQITAVVEEIASGLEAHVGASFSARSQLVQIDRLSTAQTDLEVERALRADELVSPDETTPDDEGRAELAALAEQTDGLLRKLLAERRSLFAHVCGVRPRISDATLLELYDELRVLLDQYQAALGVPRPDHTLLGMP